MFASISMVAGETFIAAYAILATENINIIRSNSLFINPPFEACIQMLLLLIPLV